MLMPLLSRIKIKSYYFFADLFTNRQLAPLPHSLKGKKNVFLYFDYEREFGGHQTDITNNNVYELLNLLEQFGLKATWFTVGKIFNAYPESIKKIAEQDHEVASHTFSHISPLNSKNKVLNKDFAQFTEATPHYVKVNGFHSPNGKWSVGLIKILKKYDFIYHVVSASKTTSATPSFVIFPNGKRLVQLASFGDDWQLYKKSPSENEVLQYFEGLLNRIPIGGVGGIGVHPWVLFSNPDILNGYKEFLKHIAQNSKINALMAHEFAQKALENKLD